MKIWNLTKLINSSKLGNQNIYTLTESGRRLGKQLRREYKSTLNEQELLLQLSSYLEKDEKKEEFKQKVEKILNNNHDIKNNSKRLVLKK